VAWLVTSSHGWSGPEAVTVAVVGLGPYVGAAIATLARRVERIATPWGTLYFENADQLTSERSQVNINWTEVAAVATAIAALTTVGLAIATFRMASKTADAAEATQRDADASQRAAEATQDSARAAQATVAEMQRTRELEWRPYLSLVSLGYAKSQDGISFTCNVTNLGRGPALRCVCALFAEEYVAVSPIFNLAPLENHRKSGQSGKVHDFPALSQMFALPGEAAIGQRLMAVCRDGLTGHWFRFIEGTVATSEWDSVTQPVPQWVELIRMALPQLADPEQ